MTATLRLWSYSNGLERGQTVSRLAFAMAVVDLIAVVCLIIFFAVGGGPFGFLNDVANGVVGALSMALAWLWVSDRSADGAESASPPPRPARS